jgi:hypothetical protein
VCTSKTLMTFGFKFQLLSRMEVFQIFRFLQLYSWKYGVTRQAVGGELGVRTVHWDQRGRIKTYVSEYAQRKGGNPERGPLKWHISSVTMCNISLLQRSSFQGDKITNRVLETSEILYQVKWIYNPEERELHLYWYSTCSSKRR